MAVRSTLQLLLRIDETGTADLGATPTASPLLDFYKEMTSGTTANKHDLVYADTRTVTGNDDFDLAGAMTTPLGKAFVAVGIVGIFIRNKSEVSGEFLYFGDAASAQAYVGLFGAATGKVVVGPSGIFAWESPIDAAVVTPTTGDKVRVASGAFTITYDIVILARSA
jgi:hypothetical protein